MRHLLLGMALAASLSGAASVQVSNNGLLSGMIAAARPDGTIVSEYYGMYPSFYGQVRVYPHKGDRICYELLGQNIHTGLMEYLVRYQDPSEPPHFSCSTRQPHPMPSAFFKN